MPTPDKPSLDYSYTAFSESQGDNSFPGTQLDNDLANLKLSIDETIDFASLVIRDDGKLNNGVVTKSSLAADVVTGVAAPTVWATATEYAVEETVTTNNGLYLCLVAHTSGVFATDLASEFWAVLAVWSPLTEVSDGAISTAKLQSQAVTGPKLAPNSVDASKVQDGALTRAKMAANFGLLPIGATLDWDGPLAPAGWVFKFGQPLSRVTYFDLMAALVVTIVGDTSVSSPTVTGVSVDLRNLGLEGAKIEGPNIPVGTTVVSVTINTIVLSANATGGAAGGAAGVQLHIFPHGNGDGATTFNVPDDRDRTTVGRGNMGGTPAARITATGDGNPGVDTTRLGMAGGVDRHAVTVDQIPAHNHTASATVTDPGHAHNQRTDTGSGVAGTQAPGNGTTAGASTPTDATTTGISVSVTVQNRGGGQAHPNVQPSRSTNKIIFTGVV